MQRPPAWGEREAEAHLRSLELFGMRFGLERMRRLMTALGSPQRRYDCIHVLGTNGKTSTTRMIAAILERHGLRTAAYTSPHLVSYRERLQVCEQDISGEEFGRAIAHAAWAARRVNRTLAEDDHVTQFELLTAGALWQIAERGAQVAVIEAGLGGRYDATSVIDARLTVLTNVGLEHTRWLGPTVRDIAEEKLAVLAPGATLALGAGLAPEALAVAERVARKRGARIVVAGSGAGAGADEPALGATGAFQQRNFALARLAAERYLHDAGVELDEHAVREAAAATDVRGRAQVVASDPLTVLDGAHNPDAARALVEALPALVGERPLALVLGVLEDKDAVGMLATLLALCERAWFTAPPSARALSPAALQSLARQLGFERSACEPRPALALAAAQRWAGEHGGAVLATGSVYLVGELLGGLADAVPAQDSAAGRRRAVL
ncbi:MAG TPA: cyanophycin synthetase [Solirubrobacteraceae bacterium]|nr:cyanophycin synthetase [Solirubrobacteraceae bacterium]